MPLHDSGMMNCKKGATAENQGSGVKYMGSTFDDCVLSDLTWQPLLGGGRKSWYIFTTTIIIIIIAVDILNDTRVREFHNFCFHTLCSWSLQVKFGLLK